ncbi:hypothetical protein GCM10022293_46060 [Azospirillum formosense]
MLTPVSQETGAPGNPVGFTPDHAIRQILSALIPSKGGARTPLTTNRQHEFFSLRRKGRPPHHVIRTQRDASMPAMGPTLPASDELCADIKLAVIFPLEVKPDTSLA